MTTGEGLCGKQHAGKRHERLGAGGKARLLSAAVFCIASAVATSFAADRATASDCAPSSGEAVDVCHGKTMPQTRAMPAVERRGLRVFNASTPMEIGNYDVTFTFGDETKPTENWVKFEGRRLAFEKIATAPGETKKVTFTARVKGPVDKGGKVSKKFAKESRFTHALDLTVVTSADSVAAPEVKPNAAARTIYLCGDSTVTDQPSEPWGSWGQIIPAFFREGTAVANFARSGLKTSTFISQGRLRRVLSKLREGDVVVIQFGHNDQKDPALAADAAYSQRLVHMIDKVKAKGAKAVLVTPVERLRFEADGTQGAKTLAEYAEAVKKVAAAHGVPVVDLNDASYRMYAALGAEQAVQLFCTYSADAQRRDFGTTGRRVRELADKTHHSVYGAYVFARYVAGELSKAVPELKSALREGFAPVDPAKPPANPQIPPTGTHSAARPAGDTGNKE